MKPYENLNVGDIVILQNNKTAAVITGVVSFVHRQNIFTVEFFDYGIKFKLNFSRKTGKVYNSKNFSYYYIQSIKPGA